MGCRFPESSPLADWQGCERESLNLQNQVSSKVMMCLFINRPYMGHKPLYIDG